MNFQGRAMSSDICISVIVPIYNVEEYVAECLQTIENQSFVSYEVILVNDGSTDSSVEIVKPFVDRNANWRLIHKKNEGLSSARNTGIAEAKGEYICFVDSDDFIASDYLQKLYEAARQYQTDIVIADYHEVDAAGQDIAKNKGRELYKQGLISQAEALDALTWVGECHYATAMIVAWNKLVRTDIMKKLKYPEGVLHEDEFLIMPMIIACDTIVWIRDDIYAYRQREGSIMQDERLAFRHLKVLDAFEERIRLCEQLDNQILQCKLKKAYFWNIEVWYYFMRTKYKLPWYKLHGFFARRMWRALQRYGYVWGKRKLVKYIVFVCSPEVYLKHIYK